MLQWEDHCFDFLITMPKSRKESFELEFDIKKMSRLQRSITKARENTVNMPRAMEAQQYCTFNYNEHLCVLQTQAVSPAIICQLLVSGQRCSIWRDHSFTLRAFALAKEEEKNSKKSSQHIIQISVYWGLLLLIFVCAWILTHSLIYCFSAKLWINLCESWSSSNNF